MMNELHKKCMSRITVNNSECSNTCSIEGRSVVEKYRLPDPSPVFTAFDAVHGHFADFIFVSYLLNGEFSFLIVQGVFYLFDLCCSQFQANCLVCLLFLYAIFAGLSC